MTSTVGMWEYRATVLPLGYLILLGIRLDAGQIISSEMD